MARPAACRHWSVRAMDIGPVDILEVAFPGNEFNVAILPAL